MAESMHNSSDIPNFDTYPSTPPERLLDTKSVGKSSLEERAAELGTQARDKSAELGRQAKTNYYRARLRAQQTVREYPVQTALAAGAAGLLLGIALRIGRARRAY